MLINPKIYREVLDNGLVFIYEERPWSKAAGMTLAVMAGPCNESRKDHGISHLLEHILITGPTTGREAYKVKEEIGNVGGFIQAETFVPYPTTYRVHIQIKYMDLALNTLYDIVTGNKFDEGVIKKEKEIIINEIHEEREKSSDIATTQLSKMMYKEGYTRYDSVGEDKSIKEITTSDLREYYKLWYTPCNMTLTVVGREKYKKVLCIVKKVFGQMKKGRLRKIAGPPEVKQRKARKRILRRKQDTTHIQFRYHTDGLKSKDCFALDVIRAYLSLAPTKMLYKKLRYEKGWIYGVNVVNWYNRKEGEFIIKTKTRDENELHVIETIESILEKISSVGLTKEELDTVKTWGIGSESRLEQNALERAEKLSKYNRWGMLDLVDNSIDAIKKVTNKDIKKAARKYLRRERMNIVVLRPMLANTGKPPALFAKSAGGKPR